MVRRLSAIFAADMVGYARLIEADEAGTLKRQKVHRKELIDPAFERHHGRIVKEMGDGILVEFASVVDAVQCAVEIQNAMPEREAEIAEDRRIAYRIGINLGDIIVDGDDIYGDGVNIAARLEQLAQPGGICISGTVYDHLKSQVEVGYQSLGEVQVKNIERPVRAFRVLRAGEKPVVLPLPKMRRRLPVAVALLVAIIAGAVVWYWQRPDFAPVDPAKMALELPEIPSIAVLPFEPLGEDRSRAWLGEALAESIISTLSNSSDMVVIARTTAFALGARKAAVGEVARELGVRYVLTGSILEAGDKLRITSELSDAIAGRQLWSIREDVTEGNLLDLQDMISRRVGEELSVTLTVGEQARTWLQRAGSFESYQAAVEGRAEFQKFSPEGNLAAERIWTKLYEEQPDAPFILTAMGWIHWQKVTLGISSDVNGDMVKARIFSKRSLELEETGDGYVLAATLALPDYERVIRLADKGIALAPGSADTNAIGGYMKAISGQTREGLELMERAMRLEPYYPVWLPGPVNFARLELGRLDDVKALANAVLEAEARDALGKAQAAAMLTVAHVFAGEMEEARGAARRLREIYPQASGTNARKNRAFYRYQEFNERYVQALIAAGIPE